MVTEVDERSVGTDRQTGVISRRGSSGAQRQTDDTYRRCTRFNNTQQEIFQKNTSLLRKRILNLT